MTGRSGVAALDGRTAPDGAVVRARAGDLGAFEELYRHHAGRVYALCLRMAGDRSRAEDHAQETFVRAWRSLGSFRGESGFSAWLTRIAVNVVLGERRSHRRFERGIRALVPPRPASRPAAPPLDLERAIAGLPARARAVFVLHDVEGYRHAEIAGLLGLAQGTSKSQLHRARKLLREALE